MSPAPPMDHTLLHASTRRDSWQSLTRRTFFFFGSPNRPRREQDGSLGQKEWSDATHCCRSSTNGGRTKGRTRVKDVFAGQVRTSPSRGGGGEEGTFVETSGLRGWERADPRRREGRGGHVLTSSNMDSSTYNVDCKELYPPWHQRNIQLSGRYRLFPARAIAQETKCLCVSYPLPLSALIAATCTCRYSHVHSVSTH